MARKTAGEHSLPAFEDAQPLGARDRDADFVRELTAVLDKHGNLDRFGLCLLHEHFPMAPDEVLVETNDPQARTLTMTVEKTGGMADIKPTQWRFLSGVGSAQAAQFRDGPYEVMLVCKNQRCAAAAS